MFLFLYFSYNYDHLDRYLFSIYNYNNSSLLQYVGLWKTGLFVFLENPNIIGIGPTNVQNYVVENLLVSFDPLETQVNIHTIILFKPLLKQVL